MNKKMLMVMLAAASLFLISCTKEREGKMPEEPNDRNIKDYSMPAKDVYRVRVVHFAPHSFNHKGKWTGLDIELLLTVIRETGLKAEFVELPWSRAIHYVKTGKIDIILNFSKRPDRMEYTHYIGPQRLERLVLAVHKKNRNFAIQTIDDFIHISQSRGKKFVLQKDIAYENEFDKRLKSDSRFASAFVYVSSKDDLIKVVNSGRGLGLFEEFFGLSHLIATDPRCYNLVVHPFVLSVEPIYFGLSKKTAPGKLEKFKKAYEKVEADGTLEAIRQEWINKYTHGDK